MRVIRLSGLEGGVALIRHPYPYRCDFVNRPTRRNRQRIRQRWDRESFIKIDWGR
jgi:hypothetical protein